MAQDREKKEDLKRFVDNLSLKFHPEVNIELIMSFVFLTYIIINDIKFF